MRLERIIVGIDFSASSIAAARWIATHFAPSAELILAHSVFIPEPPRFLRGRFPSSASLIENARAGAEARLVELARSLEPAKTRVEICVGHPAEQMPLLAMRLEADLLVVGKHGERPAVWRMLGTTAEQLLRTAKTPVLLVAGVRDVRPRRILLALDDVDASSQAVDWARGLALRFGAQATALHVVTSVLSTSALALAAAGAVGLEPDPHAARAELYEEVDRFVQELVPAAEQPRWQSECVFGKPGREIVAMADERAFELIVMGGGGSVIHPGLGGITREVLRGAHCPVLVTPHALSAAV
jgi:nucleotide-binding universal stress UspA family protein